jgi:hypothetical protein
VRVHQVVTAMMFASVSDDDRALSRSSLHEFSVISFHVENDRRTLGICAARNEQRHADTECRK